MVDVDHSQFLAKVFYGCLYSCLPKHFLWLWLVLTIMIEWISTILERHFSDVLVTYLL